MAIELRARRVLIVDGKTPLGAALAQPLTGAAWPCVRLGMEHLDGSSDNASYEYTHPVESIDRDRVLATDRAPSVFR